ncbi:hypothetical protein [Niallia sp. BSM11]|uniref:hypothetical protein n=1 Tax=Niallia sp. BSM11 TaxID=3391576 RepID=UPI003984913C
MKESIRKWKKAIKVFLLIKVTNNFIGVTDTIENKAYRGINTLYLVCLIGWQTEIAKTLTMVIPI